VTDRSSERVLILGGAGMVGLQVAREVSRELEPEEVIISSLTEREVDEAITVLRDEAGRAGWETRFVAAPGDIFLPQSLQGKQRGKMISDRALFDQLFDDIFAPAAQAYSNSALYRLIEQHRPTVIVDCINTATAISYQDVFTTSRRVKLLIDQLETDRAIPPQEIDSFIRSIRELLIAQGVPQITRHILFLHRALRDSGVRVYVKVGTTGTGGMGINIPYTHSEERPSPTLLSKSAIGFAHTGLLFLLARTPGLSLDDQPDRATMIKEIKPGAMIGFKRLGVGHVRLPGPSGGREPGFLLEPRTLPLTHELVPRESFSAYRRFGGRDIPVQMVGADTGENGFFSIGEFEAVTYPRQMEYVTPEEVARTVVLEITGAATGRDVIAAIDGAITEPSYRAGVLRHHAIREMERLEKVIQNESDVLPSIAIGHLGPPRLSKLLIEAWLIRAATGSSNFSALLDFDAAALGKSVEAYLQANPRILSLITTIGIPVLREGEGGRTLTRGPRLSIPVPLEEGEKVSLDAASTDRYAFLGWVDLRERNFEAWRARIRKIAERHPDIVEHGSASFDRARYIHEDFRPGDVVGWLLTNETDEQGMVGHRIL
jgi:hypothetical protein